MQRDPTPPRDEQLLVKHSHGREHIRSAPARPGPPWVRRRLRTPLSYRLLPFLLASASWRFRKTGPHGRRSKDRDITAALSLPAPFLPLHPDILHPRNARVAQAPPVRGHGHLQIEHTPHIVSQGLRRSFSSVNFGLRLKTGGGEAGGCACRGGGTVQRQLKTPDSNTKRPTGREMETAHPAGEVGRLA